MAGTTARALALLDLLQTRRRWTGAELVGRLGVTDRTLRRDVERLRGLGYEVTSTRGAGGGYRLAAGSALPPLLLTDDEAVTVALGLRTVAVQGLVDGEHTTLTALAKLEQVLPTALRRRVAALGEHLLPLSPADGAHVRPDLLGELALACRDGERVRFRYQAADGAESDRVVEPAALVASRRSWFLLAWDRTREDWRTFRADRASRLVRLGVRDPRREVPGGDPAALVAAALGRRRAGPGVEVVLDLPLPAVRERLGGWAEGAWAEGDDRSVWPVGGSSAAQVLSALAWLPTDVAYEVRGDPTLLAGVAEAARRALAATGG